MAATTNDDEASSSRRSRKRSSRSPEEEEELEESPSKRQAVEEEEEEDGEEEEEGLEMAEEDDDEAVEDKEEDKEEDEEEEEEEEEEVEIQASSLDAMSRVPEAGIVQKVYVENFMCHAKFSVDLCRNVNFITGQNGSGKSAILAAIQICLGAGARRTHRARNLKDLVRKDSGAANDPRQAKIQVTLLNKGSDAFEPQLYGDTITVERTISLGGGYNGYKLYGHDMMEKSRSKKDLDAMLDKLNIQVENPVAVLDQEEAKKFLLGKADDKYSFFMKATELSRIDNTHASTLDKVDELDEARERLKAGLRRKEVQIKELRSKCEQHKQLGKMKLKLLQQQVLLAFTIHSSHDEQYETTAANVKAYQEAISQQEKKLADSEAAAKNPDEQMAGAQAKMDQLSEEGEQQAALKTQLEQELRDKCHPCKVAEREMKDLHRKHKDADQKLKRAQDELQQARNLILQRNGQSEQARLMEEQKTVEEQINQHKEQTNQLKQNVSHSLREYEELEPHVQNARNQVRNIEGQLSGVKNTIKSLGTSGDSLAMLGPRAKPMFQRVEEAKRKRIFKGPVVGPIGHYVKIRPGKEAYAAVAEFAIGHGTLDRFIVTNPHDRKALEKIRRQVGCRSDCGIFQIGNRPRFTFRTTPPDGVETLHTILQIEHDLVFNCLADNAGLETTALCSDKATSERQLLRRNGSGEESIVGGINQVYLLPDGDNWTVRSGSRAMFTNEKKLRKTIGVDTTVALEEARKEEAQLKEDLRNYRTEESKLEHQHTDSQRNWNKAKQAFQANRREIDTLENRLEEIRGEIESTETVDMDTSELEQEIESYQQEKDSIVQQEQDVAAQIEDMQPAIEEAKAKLNECAARNDRVLTEMSSAELELTQQLESKSQLEAQVEKRRKKLEKTQAALATLQEKLDVVEGEKEKSLRNARLLMFRYNALKKQDDSDEKKELEAPTEEDLEAIEPFDPPKDHAYYEAKIDTVKKKISVEKEKRAIAKDNEADAQEKYSRALEDFKNSKVSLTEIQENIGQLEEDMKKRKLRWKDMRNHLKSTTKIQFKELLSLNKYSGEVKFSDKEKTLDLIVGKEKGKDGRSKDVKSLSGGERSYTTMCLLLALGERLETPFRILDEFDVFLDGPTRRLTIDMLIHLAKTKMGHRQFIFITPQDLSNISPDPQLRIHRLKPPERNQRVGGPSQQTLNFSQSA